MVVVGIIAVTEFIDSTGPQRQKKMLKLAESSETSMDELTELTYLLNLMNLVVIAVPVHSMVQTSGRLDVLTLSTPAQFLISYCSMALFLGIQPDSKFYGIFMIIL